MRITREEDRLFLWLTPKEFEALEDILIPTERISWQILMDKGLHNYILDYPVGEIVAILDIEEKK